MTSAFSDFADAMARPVRPVPVTRTALDRIAVLGGGPEGRMLAAIALSEGCEVTLFSAYAADRERMAVGISIRGEGPVGSYQVNADAAPSVRTTSDLDTSVQNAQAIFLTGPVHKQRTYAMVLADHLTDGQTIVVAPGRTFGALETRWLLGIGGCRAEISVVEMPLPFWCRTEASTLHLTRTRDLPWAVLPGAAEVPGLLFDGSRLTNSAASSFSDCSGVFECVACLMGGLTLRQGGPVIPMGGTPLPENNTFANLFGVDHKSLLQGMLDERRETARRFGQRNVSNEIEIAMDLFAGDTSGAFARPIPSRAEATEMLRDAVIGSLVPLTSAARLVDVATPLHDSLIALASSVLEADLATAGRKLPAMGVDGANPDAARRALEQAVG